MYLHVMYTATGWQFGSNPSGKREAEQLQKMQIEYHVLVQDIRFFRHHPKTVKKLVCQNLLTLVHLTQKGYCDEKVSEQEFWC